MIICLTLLIALAGSPATAVAAAACCLLLVSALYADL